MIGSILVVGSLNMDQVVSVPRLPQMGETLLGAGSLNLVPGGKGANQAVAMARLGGSVAMAGRVGSDTFGSQLIQALHHNNVNTDLVAVDQQEASGVAFIFLSPNKDNAIVVSSGANGQVGKDQQHDQQIIAAIKQCQALVLQLEIPLETVERLITIAHDAGVPVILNLAPAHQLAPDILRQVSVLVVNENEASLISGQPVASIEDARSVAIQLQTQGITTVVITLGARGALLTMKDSQGELQSIYHPAPKMQVVDTTAAGDCFVGGLTVALVEGQTAADSLRFAITASALKVTKFGAQSGLPTRDEVQAALHS